MGRSEVIPYQLNTYDGQGRKSAHYWSGRKRSTATMKRILEAMKEFPEAIRGEVIENKTGEVIIAVDYRLDCGCPPLDEEDTSCLCGKYDDTGGTL